MALKAIIQMLPEVRKPDERKISFNTKLKWTIIILVAFFILYNIPLHGLSANSLERFSFLATVLGTDFGSVISLGIGPIVMASIILQLLVGSGLLGIDTKTEEGKRYFQGLQKLGVIFFIFFEAIIYVTLQGLQALPGFQLIVIGQLVLGGIAIMFMDEVVSKWGFGSGVSLFIVAGVALQIFVGLFQFIGPAGENCLADFANTPCAGKILVIIQSIIDQNIVEALFSFKTILVTIAIFLIVVWAQSLKVEIPLSFDRLRGYGIKWPLQFFYTSNMPVILTAALIANYQLFASLIENWVGHATILGGFQQGTAVSGLAFWVGHSDVLGAIIRGNLQLAQIGQGITHLIIYMLVAMVFAVFWVKTTGMDAGGQAKNILGSGLQIPGFRRDERILESILARYIMPLTIMGGLAIGLLAGLADLTGTLTSGTSILLAVMITYQIYQNIAQQHATDMHPALRKVMT